MKNELTTGKLIKYKGTRFLIDPQTGEIISAQYNDIQERDFNFTKVWMRNYLQSLDIIGNKKIKVANWLIEKLSRDNTVIASYEEIAKQIGVSRPTVLMTIQALIDANFMVRVRNAVYKVNPDVLYKGSRESRLSVLTEYRKYGEEVVEPSPEQRLQNLKTARAKLQREIENTEKEIEERNAIPLETEDQFEFNKDGEIVTRAHEAEDK